MTFRKSAIRVHAALAWAGLATLLLWGVSGVLHPLMVLFGPEPQAFYPPQGALTLDGARPLSDTLEANGVTRASTIKLVAGLDGAPLLQVTQSPDAPRRWFDARTGAELAGHDRERAVALARHYTGRTDTPIERVHFQTAFDADYPWINRLIPVYRVDFTGPAGLTAYVHTETEALALLSDTGKRRIQRLFSVVHTWSWVPAGAEWLRVTAMALLVLSLICMLASGIYLLTRRRTAAAGPRRWHRLVGWSVLAPLLLLTTSGVFHLLHDAGTTPARLLTMPPLRDLEALEFPLSEHWARLTDELPVNALSLVALPRGGHVYRLGVDVAQRDAFANPTAMRHAHFDGVPRTGPAVYLDAQTGAPWRGGDRELALQLAEHFTDTPRDAIETAELVTRFGPEYDFRNKRLPVWKIHYGAPLHTTYFIDTAAAALVDRRSAAGRLEAYSFSFLHKWNFLHGLGRTAQNAISAAVVSAMVLCLGATGLVLKRRRRRRDAAPRAAVNAG